MRAELPARAFRTFAIDAPLATHYRAATCVEVACEALTNGWVSTMLAGSDDLAFLERVCRGEVDGHRRHYVSEPVEGGFVRLTFPAGQVCFAAAMHRVPLERPAIFSVRAGDIGRAVERPTVHARPEHWVEQLAETLDGVRHNREKG